MTSAPHWTAYLTPVIQLITALLAGYIAYKFGSIQASISRQQAETSVQQAATAAASVEVARNRLKFDLFQRRLEMYDLVYAYIDTVFSDRKIIPEKDSKFLAAVRATGWLTDEAVVNFIHKDLREKMIELSRIAAQLESTPEPGQGRIDLQMQQSVVQLDLYNYHERLARVFEPFLKLAH